MPPTDRNIALGTIFTARMDQSFLRAIRRIRTSVRELSNVERILNRTLARSRSAVREHTETLHRNTQALRQNRAAARQAATSAQTANNEYALVGRQISKVSGAFERLSAAIKVTASYTAAAMATFGTLNAIRQGTAAIFEHSQALKNLQAITSATNAEMLVMDETLREVSGTTKFSTQEVADSMVTLGQAGLSAQEAMDAANSVAMLATGTLSELKETADLVTTALKAFKIEASDSARVADIFASAVNKSKLNIDKIRTAFNYVAPTASKAKLSLEETASAMMVLANSGLRGSTIGTGLRRVLSQLIAPNKDLAEAFKDAGARMEDLNPATNEFRNIIGELERIVPNAQRAFELFGLRGAAAVSSLTNVGREGFMEMENQVYRVGVATEMAEKQMEGLQVMAKNLFDRLELLAVAIGEGGIASAFRVLLEIVRPLVSWFTEFASSAGGKMVVAFTSLTAVVISLRTALKFVSVQLAALAAGTTIQHIRLLTSHFGALTVAVNIASTAFQRMMMFLSAHPFFAIASGVSAALVAIKTLIDHVQNLALEMEKEVLQIDKTLMKLSDYRDRLEELDTGSKKYRATMQRLINDFPELREHVNLATMEFRDGGEALDEMIQEKNLQKFSKLSDLAREYENKANRAKLSNLGLADSFSDTWDVMKDITMRNYIGLMTDLNNKFNIGEYAVNKFSDAVGWLGDTLGATSEDTRKFTEQQVRVAQSIAHQIMEFEKYENNLEGVKQAFRDMGKDSSYYMDELAPLVVQQLDKIQSRMEKHEEATSSMSDAWEELYKSLDEAQKDSLQNMHQNFQEELKVLQRRLAANENTAKTQEQLEAEYTNKRVDLLKKYEKKIEETFGIQVDLSEEANKQMVEDAEDAVDAIADRYDTLADQIGRAYEYAQRRINDHYDWQRTLAENTIDDEVKLQKRILDIERQRMRDSMELAKQEKREKVDLVRQEYLEKAEYYEEGTDKLKELQEEAIEEGREIYRESIDDRIDALEDWKQSLTEAYEYAKEQEREYTEEIKKLQKEIREIRQETADTIFDLEEDLEQDLFDIRAEGMEDDERRRAEFERAQQEMSQAGGLAEEGQFDRAQDLMGGVISSLRRLASEAQRAKKEGEEFALSYEKLIGQLEAAYKKQQEIVEKAGEADVKTKEEQIKKLEEQRKAMEKFASDTKKRIQEVNSKLSRLNDIQMQDKSFKIKSNIDREIESIDRLQQKLYELDAAGPFTYTVEKETVGGGAPSGGGGGGTSTYGGSTEPTITEPSEPTVIDPAGFGDEELDYFGYRLGGMIKKLAGGMKLPGYGGGDKIPALLEPGEWVIRKEAVKKYGSDFFRSLNEMSAGMSHFAKKSIPRMSSGGQAGAGDGEFLTVRFEAGGVAAPVKIHDPASRTSMKKFAKEMSKMRLSYAR